MSRPLARIVLTMVLIIGALLALSGILDEKGAAYTHETLKRALVVFGVARALNGVISVAQGTEIAIQPAGIGINFTPGEILDPVNDLVERFSWVMLASSASLGIQKVLLDITAWPPFSWATVLLLLLLTAIVIWWPRSSAAGFQRVMLRVALVMMVLRLAVAGIAIVSELVYEEFLLVQYSESTQQLQNTTERIGTINKTVEQGLPQGKDESILESAKRLYSNTVSAVDIEARMQQYQAAAADASRHVINLIVVFVFQTILLPLAFLFGAYLLIKRLVKSRLNAFSDV